MKLQQDYLKPQGILQPFLAWQGITHDKPVGDSHMVNRRFKEGHGHLWQATSTILKGGLPSNSSNSQKYSKVMTT